MRVIELKQLTRSRRGSLGQAFDPSVNESAFDCPLGFIACQSRLNGIAFDEADRKFGELTNWLISGGANITFDEACNYARLISSSIYYAVAAAWQNCSTCWGDYDYAPIDQHMDQKLNELNAAIGLNCDWSSGSGGGAGYGQSKGCTNKGGSCQSTNASCSGNFVSNLCPGPSDWKCCVPAAGSGGGAGGGGNQNQIKPKPKDKTAEYVAYAFIGLIGVTLIVNLNRN